MIQPKQIGPFTLETSANEKKMPGSLSVDIMVETSQRPAGELSPGWENELWQAPHRSKSWTSKKYWENIDIEFI